ncbi:nuclear transport factor 2 family protein [Sphingobium sp.]|jgi:ketosteroid isomerase-like protein|uniref:nuclear transport factor 2 family protein n=1 Tax=Sphingobium sp. TaxID=1912891 RepID=UPI00260E98B4|nr:nuclear transport factor 2 family protein [Sphingobium sp.]
MNSLSEIASSFMGTFNAGDYEAMLAFISEGAVYNDPHGIEHEGRAAIGDALAPGFAVSDSHSRYQVTSTLIDEEQSMALVTWTLHIAAPDGTASAIEGLDILHVRDGKIVRKDAFCKAADLAFRKTA